MTRVLLFAVLAGVIAAPAYAPVAAGPCKPVFDAMLKATTTPNHAVTTKDGTRAPRESGSPMAAALPAESASALTSTPALGFPSSQGPTPASPLPTQSPTQTATQTIPPEPAGLAPGWASQDERNAGSPEADLVVRTGDINNLGFGWPADFTPFSGLSTPTHAYPCTPRPGAAPGTDRIMLGIGVTADTLHEEPADGYSDCSTRPGNLPQAIVLHVGELPPTIRGVYFQMFVDDFQAMTLNSHFQVSLNGTRIPAFEDTINLMDQTGPVGKLVTLRLLPEYWELLRSGTVRLLFDDPTTGRPDGYAVDFVRILVNPHGFRYTVSIECSTVDAGTNKPIAGASVSAAQVTATTARDGTCTLRGVPAGIVAVGASAVGYDSQTQLVDLPAGQSTRARFALKRHRESANSLQNAMPGLLTVTRPAQPAASSKPAARPAVALVLDASGSMLQSIKGRRKIDIARAELDHLVRTVLPDGTRVALRVYGQGGPGSCSSDLMMPLAPLDRAKAEAVVAKVKSTDRARTATAASLRATAADLANARGAKRVILITDGEENCGGDVEAEIAALRKSGVDVELDVVGFAIDSPATGRTFAKWAGLGGGRYYEAKDVAALDAAVGAAVTEHFDVVDAAGAVVASGEVGGKAVSVAPGHYTVRVHGQPDVSVQVDVPVGASVTATLPRLN